MKKILCLLLSLLMLLGCVDSVAEGTDADAVFLRIPEGQTVQVFQAPGDANAIDTLKAGQFCGLIEETANGGTAWYHVFYLNGKKESCVGYIRAGEAEKLGENDLEKLLADPVASAGLMELLAVLYEAGSSGGSSGGSITPKTPEKTGSKLLKYIRKIRKLSEKLLKSKDLKKLKKKAAEIKEKLKPIVAGVKEKVKPKVTEIKEKLKPKVTEIREKVKPKVTEIREKVKKKIGEGEIVKKIKELFGNAY